MTGLRPSVLTSPFFRHAPEESTLTSATTRILSKTDIANNMIASWKNIKQALSPKHVKDTLPSGPTERFEPRNYYYVGPTCITTSCDIFPRRMGVKATAPQHFSPIQEIVRDCAARFLMVSTENEVMATGKQS